MVLQVSLPKPFKGMSKGGEKVDQFIYKFNSIKVHISAHYFAGIIVVMCSNTNNQYSVESICVVLKSYLYFGLLNGRWLSDKYLFDMTGAELKVQLSFINLKTS